MLISGYRFIARIFALAHSQEFYILLDHEAWFFNITYNAYAVTHGDAIAVSWYGTCPA